MNNPQSDPKQVAIGKNIAQAWGANASASVTVYEFAPPAPVDADTLAEARAQLAQLPTDHVPPPATLPTGSRMPYSRNPHFVGREAELMTLARLLKADQTPVINQVATTGLGGIGKTQLAAAFVHRYGQYFTGGVYWLSLADPTAVPSEVALCGGRGLLNLAPDFEQLDLPTQVQLVLSAWQSALPRLLIFDNCEHEALLARWRPPHGGCRVLITSRRQEWSRTLAVQPLPLPTLPREKSIELLRKFLPDVTDLASLEAIAAELGDLPLALHLAGSFLARYRRTVSPADYLAQLKDPALLDHPSLIGRGADYSPTEHDLHVARTFALSYQRLDSTGAIDLLARQLLARAACFAPGEPIPTNLLLATIEAQNEQDYASLALDLDDALSRLTGLGLMEAETGDRLRLHRLLAAFARQAAPDPHAQPAVEQVVLAETRCINHSRLPDPLLIWQPHLRHITKVASSQKNGIAADLCNELGSHLLQVGDYAEARSYYEQALTIREQVFGPDHPDTTTSLNNLGYLLYVIGDYATAQPYLRRALDISKQVLGPAHPDTATSLNNLGLLLDALRDYAGARLCYEQALTIREKVLGAAHPDTAQSLNNLGHLLQGTGDYQAARPFFERALAINEQILGSNHPDTARSLNNLALLLQAEGDYAGAKPYLERALVIWEQGLGPDHPDTALSLNNLAYLLQAEGNYAGAKQYYKRALAIFEKVLGLEHPYTQTVKQNLAFIEAKINS